jgi:lipase chaperone LimK
VAAVALLGTGLAFALTRERPSAPAVVSLPAPLATPALGPAARTPDAAPALPESLRGTDVGGDLQLDAQGRFVAGPEALALFDYFLAATGEEPPERIRARIVAEIGRRVPAGAARDAEELLDRYLGYRAAAAELFAARDLALADPERRFQRIRELRREWFGADLASALFAGEEQVIAVELERQRVAQDAELDSGERARLLAALEAQLPEAERAARREALAAIDLRAAEAALREAGAGPAEIDAERERRFGAEAAARLAALDRSREEWNARVAAYRAEREALRAQTLGEDDYTEALAALRDAHFTGPERARIEALDLIEVESAR